MGKHAKTSTIQFYDEFISFLQKSKINYSNLLIFSQLILSLVHGSRFIAKLQNEAQFLAQVIKSCGFSFVE